MSNYQSGKGRVNTVLGSIPVSQLGIVLIHEHIICTAPEFSLTYSDWLPRDRVIDLAVSKLLYASLTHQIQTIVDASPASLGRDLQLLADISALSGVNIIASAGFYLYDSFTTNWLSPKSLADYLIREYLTGTIRPGILKYAVNTAELSEQNCRMLETIALTQLATGLPLFLHSQASTKSAYPAVDFLAQAGVKLNQIIIGHVADSDNINYALTLLQRDCYISIDRMYRSSLEWVKSKAKFIAELIAQGWTKKLLIAHDFICCHDGINLSELTEEEERRAKPHFDQYGLGVIHELLLPELRALGATEADLQQILVGNPADILQSGMRKN